jgi:hypothetical protein
MIEWHSTSGYSIASGPHEVEISCQDQEKYRLRLPHYVSLNSKLIRHALAVERSIDGGLLWERILFRLDISSRLRFATIFHREDRWPPWRVDAYGIHGGHLALKFQDQLIMFDLPYADSSSNREAEWQAVYFPKKRHWTLTRLRVLPY